MTGRFVAVIAVLLGVAALPGEAQAGPYVQVGVAVPPVRVALPHVDVEVRPMRPAPDYVWVEGYWTRDRYGHDVWVPGRWERVAPPPPRSWSRVHVEVPVVRHHPVHHHGHHDRHGHYDRHGRHDHHRR